MLLSAYHRPRLNFVLWLLKSNIESYNEMICLVSQKKTFYVSLEVKTYAIRQELFSLLRLDAV